MVCMLTDSAIFAQDFKKSGKRIRPFATVEPLGERLGIEVHHKCDRDDVDCAVDSISKAVDDGAKRVLVCWEHDTLSDIADKLGIKDLEYPDDRFDIVFQLHDGAMQQIYSEGCPSIDVQYENWVGTKDTRPPLISPDSWDDGYGN